MSIYVLGESVKRRRRQHGHIYTHNKRCAEKFTMWKEQEIEASQKGAKHE